MGISGVATIQKGHGVEGISQLSQKVESNHGPSTTKVSPDKVSPEKAAEVSADRKEAQTIEQQKLEMIAEAIENFIRSIQRELRIKVHNDTGRLMVQVISAEDGKVIREIPPEELLNLAAKMEEMVGILFETAA